jgi:hypothetical protein
MFRNVSQNTPRKTSRKIKLKKENYFHHSNKQRYITRLREQFLLRGAKTSDKRCPKVSSKLNFQFLALLVSMIESQFILKRENFDLAGYGMHVPAALFQGILT